MILKRILLLVFMMVCVRTADASDRYLVQGEALGPAVSQNDQLWWTTDANLVNRGSTDEVVTVRGISNGGSTNGIRATVVIPAGRSASLKGLRAWATAPNAPLWIVHLDAPESVVVEGILSIGTKDISLLGPLTDRHTRFGTTQLPVYRSFVPAGERQVHVGTDLGGEISTRVNVGVFNAGTSTASALIEFRQHCDDALLASTSVSVAPNTLVHLPGLGATALNCPSGQDPLFLGARGIYTMVSVDRPSISFVSVLANTLTPSNSISIRR